MFKRVLTYIAVVSVILSSGSVTAQEKQKMFLDSEHLEVLLNPRQDFAWGNVVIRTGDGDYFCDSAIWVRGKSINMKGNVIIDEKTYRISADSVFYDIPLNEFIARGEKVELWSKEDSLFLVGRYAHYNRNTKYFFMEQRPTMFLKYPDTANMIEVRGNFLEYDSQLERAEASGRVIITTKDISTLSGCAVMYPKKNLLDLSEKPRARRGHSIITGEFMTITTENDIISQIDVIDSANGEFNEPTDSLETDFDKSILSGHRIIFDFVNGEMDKVTCFGQAYSWYYPASKGKEKYDENTVSGDTIKFYVVNEKLRNVEIIGGSIGTYVSGEMPSESDSVSKTPQIDTVEYRACYINYSLKDSLITLQCQSHVTSDQIELDAYKIEFDTRERIIEAYSAETVALEGLSKEEIETLEEKYGPNDIPVILKDGADELYGDYLEYSIDTRKGRIVQSKSNYEQGIYYGEKGYRSRKDIFYVKNGRYTPCDINFLHFFSCNMKLIEKNKLIAKPVVMYIGRMPVLALPYYVFPLKKGRHSGFLPFTFGNIERGDRYIRNVGYYWAASEYWDIQTAIDYFEKEHTINLYNKLRYYKRYVFDGYISGNYTRETGYDYGTASESKSTRWTIKGTHRHTFSPTFNISAYGEYQSDATYYTDYSTNLEDRLNRNTISKINFSKKFSKYVSLSGSVYHDINLDTETRTSKIPSLSLSLPRFKPFGSGRTNEEGQLETRWYNNFTFSYSPSLLNYSRRTIATEIIDDDTTEYRSRREYTTINHSASLNFSSKIAKYLTFTPSLSYRETWYKIYETDQSLDAKIDASTTYRTYSYSFGSGLQTTLYGTIYPNIFNLVGFRQVLTPKVSYGFTPELNHHPTVRGYAGGGAGSSSKRSVMTFSISQLYQAKYKKGEIDRNIDLVSINSSFTYNLENDERPFSSLNTSYSSSLIPGLRFYGNMTHSLYKPGTDELSFFSPYLEFFNFNTTFSLRGQNFLFDDPDQMPRGVDSLSKLNRETSSMRGNTRTGSSGGGKGWNMTVTYNYQQSGREEAFSKSSFVRLNLSFYLTSNTSITYSQYYNFTEHKTINNQVNITRKMMCWTGSLYWVPIGSNRGYGFNLFVTNIPAIKIDNSQNSLSSGYLQSLR